MMKKAQNTLHLVTLILVFIIAGVSLRAQSETAEYRVVAVNEADTSVESVSNIVEVQPPLEIYVPNAFTPNGDGLNEEFGPKGDGIKEFSMSIYNRWGELIYQASDPTAKWDGTFKGQPAKTGVYVYDITVQGHRSDLITKKGSVTLVR